VLPHKFHLIWQNVTEDFFLIGQSQTRIAYGSHGNFVYAKRSQKRRFFYKLTNQIQEWPMAVILVSGWSISKKTFCQIKQHFT
jgi:KaiC/GvpD/RAD55 family RecA-like ATPase